MKQPKQVKPFSKGQETALKFLEFIDSVDRTVFTEETRSQRQKDLDKLSLLGKQLGEAAMEAKAFTREDLDAAVKYFNPTTSEEERSELGIQMNERLRNVLFPAGAKGSLLMRQNAGEFRKK